MWMDEKKWQSILERSQQAAVVCFLSADEYLLETSAARLTVQLQQQWEDSEITRIPGEEFTLEEAVLAAGTISFFSTRRIIRINRLQPSSFSDDEMTEFCALLDDTENALFVLTVLCKNAKDRKAKKLKQLEEAVQRCGCWVELPAPKGDETKKLAVRMAGQLGADITADAAAELCERVGGDLYLLDSEISKLAAAAGYGTITREIIAAVGLRTVEADVFKMIDAVTAGRAADAFAILDGLLYLRSEPIAIAGALSSSFVDMARVATGSKHKVGYGTVFTDLSYTGNEYRLKRAGQTASRYTPAQLRAALDILAQLDTALKSSPLDDAVLLQTALAQLCGLRTARV